MPTPRGCWSSEAKQERVPRAAGRGATSPRRRAQRRRRPRARPSRRPRPPSSASRLLPAQLAGADPAQRDPADTRAGRPGHGRLPGESSIDTWQRGRGRRAHRAARPGRASATARPAQRARPHRRAAADRQARATRRSPRRARATDDARRRTFDAGRAEHAATARPGAPPRGCSASVEPKLAAAAPGRLHRPSWPRRADRRGLRPGPAPADGVLQRTRPRHRQHHQLRPHRLRRSRWPRPPSRCSAPSACTCWSSPAPRPTNSQRPAHRLHLVRLPGGHRHRGVRLRRHRRRTRPSSSRQPTKAQARGPAAAGRRRGEGRRRGQGLRRRRPSIDDDGRRRSPPGASAQRRWPAAGHHPADLVGRRHRQVRRLPARSRSELVRQGRGRGAARSPPTPGADAIVNGAVVVLAAARSPSSSPA